MNEKIRQILKYVVTALLAVFFIWLAVRKIEWAEFWQGLTQTRWGYIVLFLAASVLALVFRAVRWQKLLRPLEPDTRVIQTWDATNVGNLANTALPGVGELLRCGMVTSPRASYDKVLGTVLMERIWDVLAIVVLFVVALALAGAVWLKGMFAEEAAQAAPEHPALYDSYTLIVTGGDGQ